jgi:hypothetical protein
MCNRNLLLENGKLVKKEVEVNDDFDDFVDEHENHRLKHQESLDYEAYEYDHYEKIEHEYVTESYSVEFAKELFNALGGITKNFTGFNKADEPYSLYHHNNQVILDPSVMPELPVKPKLFVHKVKKQLLANNVLISDDMPDLLERMCRLFNFSIQPNQKLPKSLRNLVFPAQTGVGKSVSVQVYVSMLNEHSSIIVVAKVEEAINYCIYINQLSGDANYARCYFSLTDKNINDPMRVEATKLREHRCIVITHNMFRRVNKFDDTDYFSTYEDKPRDFVTIDEKLSFYDQYKLNYSQLDNLITNVEETIEQSKELSKLTNSTEVLEVLKRFKVFLLFKDDKIVTNDNSIVVRSRLINSVEQKLAQLGENVTYSADVNPKLNTSKLVGLKDKNAVLSTLRASGVATQCRKRKVIGVPFMEVHKLIHGLLSDIEPFYCEKSLALRLRAGNSSLDVNDEFDDFDKLTDEEMEKLVSLVEQGNKDGSNAQALELATHVLRVMLEVRVDELLASLEALGANKNPNYRQNTLNAVHELIDTLNYFSKNHFLIYKSNFETALLATENLTNKLGLSVVLDATAQVNEYYKLANRFLGHVGLVTAPQIRQYKNLTIHKAMGFKQSRAAIYSMKTTKEIQNIAKSYASYVLNELVVCDKVLIICHKSFTSELKKQVNDKRVEFTHWGNHVGRNDWAHCNKVMLIGWPTQNPIDYSSMINSSLESVLLTSRHLDDELLEKFEISQLADDIIQGLMRSQARVIATADSDCKETSFYLFCEDSDKARKVLGLVESQFPKATLVDWLPKGIAAPMKKTKRNNNADRIIDLLVEKSKDHDTYLRVDIQDELDINKSTMTRIIASDYFKQKLVEHGFTFKNSDGRSQQFVLR